MALRQNVASFQGKGDCTKSFNKTALFHIFVLTSIFENIHPISKLLDFGSYGLIPKGSIGMSLYTCVYTLKARETCVVMAEL